MGVNVRLAVRLGALLPFVTVLASSLAPANAAPRRVVVVNAAADQEAGSSAAAEIRGALTSDEKLAPVPSGDLTRALEAPVPTRTAADARFEQAVLMFERAREALASFAYAEALGQIDQAAQTLLTTEPKPRVVTLLAQLEFAAARIYISQGSRARAVAAFRVVRNLEPKRASLDPALYLDEVVSAYAAAGTAPPATARVSFSTTYDTATIFLDGRKLAAGTRSAQLAPGVHYVVATLAEHRPAGKRIVLAADQSLTVKMRQVPEDADERARAMRQQLIAGKRDEAAFLDAARRAVALARVDAAILLREAAGMRRIVAVVYDRQSDAIGKWTPVETKGLEELLKTLRPQPRKPPPDIVFPPPPPKPTPWYEKRWGKAVILGGSGVGLTVLGLIARSLSGTSETPTTEASWCGWGPCT